MLPGLVQPDGAEPTDSCVQQDTQTSALTGGMVADGTNACIGCSDTPQ